MKHILSVLLTTITLCSYSTEFLTYRKIVEQNEMEFPLFDNPENLKSIDKINRLLQIAELSLIIGHEKRTVFERTRILDNGIFDGKVTMVLKILENSDRVLSLKFDQEESYATMYYWTSYYNFNPQNGDLIQLEDLFTDIGYKAFVKKVKKKRIKDFRAYFKNKVPKDLVHIEDSYANDDLNDFYIQGSKIFIEGDNCFHKNLKFSGVKTLHEFNLNYFQDYLNDYGKVLFGIKNNQTHYNSYVSSCLPALYKGHIGGSPIYFYLQKKSIYADDIQATYVYSKYGKGIRLYGEYRNETLYLTEDDENYKKRASIEAKIEGNTITGIWKSQSAVNYAIQLTRE